MSQPRVLMTVHAHPDDETISTGGVMARYAAEGARVVCVTCTNGENGEIVVPEMDTPENHERLAEIRAEELARALARLGAIEPHALGYRDSGMMGLPENDDPRSLWQADLDEATGRVVRLVREVRPQVVVGYNEFGNYGHPDHIRAAQLAQTAFELAGDPSAYPEQLREGLEPWRPLKLYETVTNFARREEFGRLLQERGVSGWWSPAEEESEDERATREALFGRMAAAQGPITTLVDVRDWVEVKYAALREHATQIAPEGMFLAITAQEWRELVPTEDFTLRVSHVGVRIPEDDLFAGLRGGADQP